jgi:hypothetical protein
VQLQRQIWERNQVDPATIADDVLYTRLAETIAWTNAIIKRDDFRPEMRYHDLQPRLLHDGRDDVICEVGSRRLRALQIEIGTTLVQKCPDLLGGRLMVYFPDGDLSDGAAEQETGGFFDGYNVPPWETWVGYFEESSGSRGSYDSYLLAYVPSALVNLADSGMLVNPEECILWLSQTANKIRSRFPDDANVRQ